MSNRFREEPERSISWTGWLILIMIIGIVLLSLVGSGLSIIEKTEEETASVSLDLDVCKKACRDADCEFASYLEKTYSCFCLHDGNIVQLY